MQEKTKGFNGNQATRFKEGDRISYNCAGEIDSGVIVKWDNDSIYAKGSNIWVKWDSSGEVLNDDPDYFTLIEDQEVNSIEQAIAILVQAGYKVTLEKIN